jgi:hypothetical protein
MIEKRTLLPVVGLAIVLTTASFGGSALTNACVDFAYSPPEWQTAICLPDDPHKSLVDKSGDLLYHYSGKQKSEREFHTRVSIQVVDDAVWQKQELVSPRVPIVITRKSLQGLEIEEAAFAMTASSAGRHDLVLVHITNTGKESRVLKPKLAVATLKTTQQEGPFLVIDGKDRIACSLKITGAPEGEKYPLEALTVPAGQSADFVVQYSTMTTNTTEAVTVQQAKAYRQEAIEYWEKKSGLPFDRIQVPDPGMQALIDSSIRNIWQAREIKKGLPAFQVGPTVVCGLWMGPFCWRLRRWWVQGTKPGMALPMNLPISRRMEASRSCGTSPRRTALFSGPVCVMLSSRRIRPGWSPSGQS